MLILPASVVDEANGRTIRFLLSGVSAHSFTFVRSHFGSSVPLCVCAQLNSPLQAFLHGSEALVSKTTDGEMNVSMADIETMIGAAVRAAVTATAGGGARGGAGGGGEKGGRLDERHFRRVEKLTGPNWKEFSFQFKTAVGAASGKVREALDDIVMAGKDPNINQIFSDSLEDWQGEEITKYGAELYAVLSSIVSGDAMTVVRGVASGSGWEAWSRLSNRFDPRTPAKSLMAMMAVMQPKN